MTVLRSRKVVPTKTPPETLKMEALEPTTPARTHESSPHNQSSPSLCLTSSSHLPDALGFSSNSVAVSGAVRRRSLRLASKLNPNEEGTGKTSVSISAGGRKRKSLAEEDDSGSEIVGRRKSVEKLAACVLASAETENGACDSSGAKVEVLEVKQGVEEQKMASDGLGSGAAQVVELGVAELGSSSTLGSSRLSNGKIKTATKAKGRRKSDSLLHVEVGGGHEKYDGFLRLRSGTRIAKRRMEGFAIDFSAVENDSSDLIHEIEREGKHIEVKSILREKNGDGVVPEKLEKEPITDDDSCGKGRESFSCELVRDALLSNVTDPMGLDLKHKANKSINNTVSEATCLLHKGSLNLQPATRLAMTRLDAVDVDFTQVEIDGSESVQERKMGTKHNRRKGILVDESGKNVAVEELEKDPGSNENGLSKEEKGKGKLVEDALFSNVEPVELDVEPGDKNSSDNAVSGASHLKDNVTLQDERQALETKTGGNSLRIREYKERFRHVARKNASRFAHFAAQEEEENHLSLQAEREMPNREEVNQEIEDWPGPFSTAMKIINDRAMKLNVQQNLSTDKSKSVPLIWHPRNNQDCQPLKPLVPSLQELCIAILAKNAEAIISLENVPDELRHKLSQLLCASRRMTSHYFDLLFRGSPTEVCVTDCSWLTEEQFTRAFEGCDTNNLTVLQLDLCGRCMPDYILQTTLARSSNSLPALTTISFRGACRLSDVGLSALVHAAPALKSINLCQCSLLTSACVDTLAESLGSVLRELYIDDCQNIDAMHILPALKKLEHLEVLSLAGIQTVCDDFIRKFVMVHGQNMKELILTDCVKLTDSSLKVIAETCSRLCALDLCNICKLTDSALGYLANGCRAIQKLKLCRNAFSDEAVAAFLETCGDSLIELSLNNIRKIGHNTAISLARRSRKLLKLDLSWCRNLTDDALGLIVDSCSSLRVLKLFGCTQITNVFLKGHSNLRVKIIGLKMARILEHLEEP